MPSILRHIKLHLQMKVHFGRKRKN